MKFYNNYLSSFAQTPQETYKGLIQATLDNQFDNTTQLRVIKEQSYPFSNKYTEQEVWLNTVSDVSVNTMKVIGDYIRVLFKDIDHSRNYRGQKYLYNTNGDIEDTYLCYDKINPLSNTTDSKLIRCNNKISWIDSDSNTIVTEPIFLGYELSSTNSSVTKDATIENRRLVLLLQGNENTHKIKENQRFLISKNKAFKVTQIYDINLEDITEDYSTMITMYIEWSSVLPSDNTDLLIADYYDYNYKVDIQSTDLSLSPNSIGQLSAITTMNDEVITTPYRWSSSDLSVVKIDTLGNYQVVGLSGSQAIIECHIDGNNQVYDSITVNVIDVPIAQKEIIINPSDNIRLLQGTSVDISYGVYLNNIAQSDIVTITPSGANSNNYIITANNGIVNIKNIKKDLIPLTLTFSSGTLDSKSINITLNGIM